jgi:DNA invertase Pin-like site-specific DNA recombinase
MKELPVSNRRTPKSEDHLQRTIFYGRVNGASASPQMDLERQFAAVQAYIRTRGWGVDARYQDVASGFEQAGPQLRRALGAAASGDFDVLAVHRLDRLSRNPARVLSILSELERAGVRLVSVTESVDTGADIEGYV